MQLQRHYLWGLPLDPLTLEETLRWVQNAIEERIPRQHMVINAAKIVTAQKNPFLKQNILESHLVNVDGQAVVWAARLLGVSIPERVSGIDLMEALLQLSELREYRIYFLGSTQEILEVLLGRLKELFPRLVIAGARNGYFHSGEAHSIAEAIRDVRTDILFVGMPTPRKERFIHDYLQIMSVPFAMGVGGSFDVFAGKVRRAPRWVQQAGLEWFYRLAQEPRRLFMRYAITNTTFIGMVARDFLARKVPRKVY